MIEEVRWTPEAVVDFEEAVEWYDARSIFAADRFRRCVAQALEKIRAAPKAQRPSSKRSRVMVLKPFPQQIHYFAAVDFILILAVWHPSRDPEELLKRLRP